MRLGRNPFQGGMGFFTPRPLRILAGRMLRSQSLSGWDGVFHKLRASVLDLVKQFSRNPFQGGMGFFTRR